MKTSKFFQKTSQSDNQSQSRRDRCSRAGIKVSYFKEVNLNYRLLDGKSQTGSQPEVKMKKNDTANTSLSANNQTGAEKVRAARRGPTNSYHWHPRVICKLTFEQLMQMGLARALSMRTQLQQGLNERQQLFDCLPFFRFNVKRFLKSQKKFEKITMRMQSKCKFIWC